MSFRKAFLVGIDDYQNLEKLHGSANDCESMHDVLEHNYNEEKNFDIKTLLNDEATKLEIINRLDEVFDDELIEVGLFYFSGHGYDEAKVDGGIVCYDNSLPFKDIMKIVNKGKTRYKIIILDCCNSGTIANSLNIENDQMTIGDIAEIGENICILTACAKFEEADERNGRGVFTKLLECGLEGEASDILGNVTPAALYNFIDKALGPWEQRPFFKANVQSFVSIKTFQPRITISELKEGMSYFKSEEYEYPLDPSYEYTNKKKKGITKLKPYARPEHVKIFKLLQKFNRNGLVDPVDETFMYDAAMKSKACRLTMFGRQYWKLCFRDRI